MFTPKQPKAARTWYIAATHFLTAGFVIPLLGGIGFSVITVYVIGMWGHFGLDVATFDILFAIVHTLVAAVLIWGGVVYSSRYLLKRYIIPDASAVVRLATIYMAALGLISFTINIIWPNPEYSPTAIDLVIEFVNIVVLTAVLYFASKKYVASMDKDTPEHITSA
jgi:hypothetical protein